MDKKEINSPKLDRELYFLGLRRWWSIAVGSVGSLRLKDFLSGLKLAASTATFRAGRDTVAPTTGMKW